MPKLVIKRGNQLVKKLAVPEDIEAFTVGCEKGNDIIIKDDIISFFHLQFEQQNGSYFVRDLQSQWGTFVNGDKISARTELSTNDEVRLGKHTIVFFAAGIPPAAAVQTAASTIPAGVPHEQPAAVQPARHANINERMSGVPSLLLLNDWLASGSTPGDDTRAQHSHPPESVGRQSSAPQLREDSLTAPAPNQSPEYSQKAATNGHGYHVEHQSESMLDLSTGPEPEVAPTVPAASWDEEPPALITGDETLDAWSMDNGAQADFFSDSSPESEGGADADINHDKQALYLLGINGYYLGRKFKIKKPETRIGRDQKFNDIVIKKNSRGKLDQSISRRHATLKFKSNRWFISDKRSMSRTWINQTKLELMDEVRVRPGDELEIKSDGASHIFRMVAEDDWDYGFPRKAGSWFVRYRLAMLNAVSIIVVLAGMFALVQSFLNWNILTSRPDKLTLTETVWGASDIDSKHEASRGILDPALADVNNDGYVDLAYINNVGFLTCIDGKSKQPLWVNDDFLVVQGFPIATQDWHGAGLPDFVVLAKDMRLHAIDGRWGAEIWVSPILAGPLNGPPVVADFSGDGMMDLAVASVESSIYFRLSGPDNNRWVQMDLDDPILSVASAGDVTGDGLPNLLVGTETGKLLIIDAVDNSLVKEIFINEELNKATGSFDQNNQLRFPASACDFDGDGINDLAMLTEQANLLAVNGANLSRMWFALHDGQQISSDQSFQSMAMGDMDGDNLNDVLIQTSDGVLRALKGKGSGPDRELVIWETPARPDSPFATHPILADFDKDGTADVLAVTQDGRLSIHEGATGRLLVGYDVGRGELMSRPLIGDLDNDHSLDILLLKQDGRFYKLGTNARIPSGVVWGQTFGNSSNSNASLLKPTSARHEMVVAGLSLLAILVLGGVQYVVRQSRRKLSYY